MRAIPALSERDLARFWAKVDRSGEHWLWTGSPNTDGYGVFRIGGRQGQDFKAHRIMWLLTYGDQPPNCVLHRCDTPLCVTPACLFDGSRADNNADRDQKGRQARGERHGRAKLTEADVLAIRARSHEPQRVLATEFGVSRSRISRIVNYKEWR